MLRKVAGEGEVTEQYVCTNTHEKTLLTNHEAPISRFPQHRMGPVDHSCVFFAEIDYKKYEIS